jgi:hypothetical protein
MSVTELRQCATCTYFDNAPRTLEREIPGLRFLSSGFASVRDRDGLCRMNERYVPARASCDAYAAGGPDTR